MKKEKWMLFQMCRYQHKVTKNIKKQRKRAEAKEQNRSIETDSTKKKKKKRIYELPGKEFKQQS